MFFVIAVINSYHRNMQYQKDGNTPGFKCYRNITIQISALNKWNICFQFSFDKEKKKTYHYHVSLLHFHSVLFTTTGRKFNKGMWVKCQQYNLERSISVEVRVSMILVN